MLHNFLNYLRYELNRAPLTIEAYKNDISQFQMWISPQNPDEVDFISVTSSDIRSWLASLAKSGHSSRTLRRKIISLRTLFKWLIKTGKMNVSPLRDVPLPKIPKPLPDFIKTDEIEKALTLLADDSDSPEALMKTLIMEMFYSLGIRRAELIALNDSDISFHNAEIKVTGKRSKQRVIPVPQSLLTLIIEWQQVRNESFGIPSVDSPLFVLKDKRITPAQVYSIVHEALADSTARKKSPHALRHSFASAMLNGGAEIDSVKEFLGHSSLATTQIYTHISFSEIQKAYSNAHPRSQNKTEKE